MNRPLRLILVIILLITCSGCLLVPDRGWHGDRNRGDYGDHERGGHGDQDSGKHNEHEERH